MMRPIRRLRRMFRGHGPDHAYRQYARLLREGFDVLYERPDAALARAEKARRAAESTRHRYHEAEAASGALLSLAMSAYDPRDAFGVAVACAAPLAVTPIEAFDELERAIIGRMLVMMAMHVSSRSRGRSWMGLKLAELVLVDGDQYLFRVREMLRSLEA